MLTDSAIILPKFARPRSFAALMTLYESNYIRLRALMPGVLERGRHAAPIVSEAPGDIPLHAFVSESSRYTITLHLTYYFADAEGLVADPDLHVRVYHDARMAEALSCEVHGRHPAFAGYGAGGTELERRWARNMMLNKWLEYCADRGHMLLAPAAAPPRTPSPPPSAL